MTETRCYFAGTEIAPDMAVKMEEAGLIHVGSGASGGRPLDPQYRNMPEGPWVLFQPGPGNIWIEKQEGNCPWCHAAWKLHLRPVWIRRDKRHICPHAPMPQEVTPDAPATV